ncbi:hypothetical protein ZWY2020_046503 [Hordeum vulgare]|nr:hypothetical protein ZWY2020_046503 [Hordeum vulgare]
MPIGSPKVPYRILEDEEATWVHLNCYVSRKDTFLRQEIRCKITNHITVIFFINSPGGYLISGMAIFETMQMVTPDIYTICLGIAASMAIMLHQTATAYYRARTTKFLLEVEELHKVRETITRVYALRTGKPFWVVSEDMERDVLCQHTKPKLMDLLVL